MVARAVLGVVVAMLGAAITWPGRAPVPSPPFELRVVARDARTLADRIDRVHFGPTNGMVFDYDEGFVEGTDGAWTARWPSHARQGELVFDAGLLRRVRLHAGRCTEVVLGQRLALPAPKLATPFAPEEEWPDPPLVLGGLGARVAPGAPFLASHRVLNLSKTIHCGMRHDARVVLVGRVTGPDGAPARDVTVRLASPGSRAAERRDGGYYVMLLERSGTYELEAADADGAYARATVNVPAAGAILDLRLVARPAVRGRVVAPDGTPRPGTRLVWWTDDGDYGNHVTSRADGTFVVPTRRGGAGRLWACAPGDGARWPVAGGPAHTATTELRVVVDDAPCAGSVSVWIANPAGLRPHAVRARLWQLATGLGRELFCTTSLEHGSQFAADDLPAGRYELELFTPAHGVVACGTFASDGRNAAGLPQPPTLAPLCTVAVAWTGGTAPFAFDLVRAEGASHSWIHTAAPWRGPHHLGPGNYELWWRDGANENAPTRSHAFTVVRDATELVVRLP